MAHTPFQDITPPPRRTIKDIPLPEKKQSKQISEPIAPIERTTQLNETSDKTPISFKVHEEEQNVDEDGRKEQYENDSSERSPKWLVWSIIVVAAVAFLFVSSMFFAGAEVKVTPRIQNVPLSFTATSTKNGINGSLPYDVIILNREEGISAAAYASTSAITSTENSQQVNVAPKAAAKASGTITIYNNYSTVPQDLIATTRFQSTNGLIYRIKDAVTVPGQKTVNGTTTPGSVEAIIFADQTGEKYNSGATDFIIPGFAGSAKAKGFYARSKTTITGGVTGIAGTNDKTSEPQVVTANEQLKASLDAQIQKDLIQEAKAQMPDNYILYPAISLFSFNKASSTASVVSSSSNVNLREQGTGYMIIFDKDELSKYIKNFIQASSTEAITINGLENLVVSLDPLVTSSDLIQSNPITVSFNGTIQATWNINQKKLISDLKGESKSSLSAVLKGYPQVASAKAILKPFWKTSFPDDTTHIKVTIIK